MRIKIITDHPVAYTSPDYIMPWGTKKDNSVNLRFNTKLYNLYPGKFLRILDLGCSGGGAIHSFINNGHLGIGLEGSDYSKKMQRAAWPIISRFLHTCDITKPFEIIDEEISEKIIFDVVTAWEVMEHIAENDIGLLADNVKKHLAPDGLWIMSVSHDEEIVGGVRLHQSVFPKNWWVDKFEKLGFKHHENLVSYFNNQFVRGRKYGAPNSSHLVLSLKSGSAPPVSSGSKTAWLYDRWVGSKPQQILKRIVLGT